MSTVKEAKDYLNRIRTISYRIDSRAEELTYLKASLGLGAVQMKQEGVEPKRENNRDRAYLKMIELEDELNDEIVNLERERLDARRRIERVDDFTQMKVLKERYLNNQNWQAIADSIEKSYNHTLKIHGWALQSFASCNCVIESDSK